MTVRTKLAIGAALAALTACSSNNNANNVDLNAGTDMNAAYGGTNATDMNAAGGATGMNTTGSMNATGNTGLNAAGAGAGTTGTTNATGNATTRNTNSTM
jgi:hypothetical protein